MQRTEVGMYSDGNIGNYSAIWNENSFQCYKNGSWSFWTNGWLMGISGSGYSISWDVQPKSIFTEKLAF